MTNKGNSAVLVAIGDSRNHEVTQEHLSELAFLAETAGIETVQTFIQNLPHPDNRFFVGKGKLEEIRSFVHERGVNNVIFDDDLSPSQLRNLEKALNPKEREEA